MKSRDLNACQKEKGNILSRDEFIDKIKGEWFVREFQNNTWNEWHKEPGSFSIRITDDSIVHQTVIGYHGMDSAIYQIDAYSLDDPTLCQVPGIENMQNWTINENTGILSLETYNLCGKNDNYLVEYDDYMYESQAGLDADTVTSIIYADMKLTSNDSIWTLGAFRLKSTDNTLSMYFEMILYAMADYQDTIYSIGEFFLERP